MRHPQPGDLPASSGDQIWGATRPRLVEGVIQPLGVLLIGALGTREHPEPLRLQDGEKWLVSLQVARVAVDGGGRTTRVAFAVDGRLAEGTDVLMAVLAFEPCMHLPWDTQRLLALSPRTGEPPAGRWEDLLVGGGSGRPSGGWVRAHMGLPRAALGRRIPHPARMRSAVDWSGFGPVHSEDAGALAHSASPPPGLAARRKPLLHRPMHELTAARHLAQRGGASERSTATSALSHAIGPLLLRVERRGRPLAAPPLDPAADAYWFLRRRAGVEGQTRAEAAAIARVVEVLRVGRRRRRFLGARGAVEAWRRDLRSKGFWRPVVVPLVDLGTAAPRVGDEVPRAWRSVSGWLRAPEVADAVHILQHIPTCRWLPSPFLLDWRGPPAGLNADQDRRPYFRVEVPLEIAGSDQQHWIAAMGGSLGSQSGWPILGLAGFAEDDESFKAQLARWFERAGVSPVFERAAPASVATVTPCGPVDPHGPVFDAAARPAAARPPLPSVDDQHVRRSVLSAVLSGRWSQAEIARRYSVPPQTVSDWARRAAAGAGAGGGETARTSWRAAVEEMLHEEPDISVRRARARLIATLGEAGVPSRATVGRFVKKVRSG